MVVSAGEAFGAANDEQSDLLSRAETRIDKGLSSFDATRGYCAFQASLFNGIKSQQLKTLLDAYRQVGWCVELIADFRDGDFYKFTMRTSKGAPI